MANYCERLQVKFERTPTGYLEDVDVVTMHFSPPVFSESSGPLSDTARAAVETAFQTFWTGRKIYVHSHVALSEFRWYEQLVWPTPSPVRRVNDIANVAGSSGASTALPPQVAMSFTLVTATRRRWGRFYMPVTSPSIAGAVGRIAAADVDTAATQLQTFLNACRSANAIPVVWSPRGGVGPPAFAAGDFQEVTSCRVDDILDIQRSRRWQASPYRKTLALT